MHRETLIRTGARRPIVVGDRLDTDIEGANAVGCPSLLVFSGVTDVRDLLEAPDDLRPTHVGADVGGLLVAHPAPTVADAAAACGAWRAVASSDGVELRRHSDAEGSADDSDVLDAVRALCAAAWAGGPAAQPGIAVRGADAAATAALNEMGLG